MNHSAALFVKRRSSTAVLPSRGSPGAAGYDLSASETRTITAKSHDSVPTDISIVLPEGTYGRIAPRSGLTAKFGINVGAGVIDADFCGKISVILFNHGARDLVINIGDKIAQLIITKIETPDVVEVFGELPTTQRGENGFGSTGGISAMNNSQKL